MGGRDHCIELRLDAGAHAIGSKGTRYEVRDLQGDLLNEDVAGPVKIVLASAATVTVRQV